MMQDEEEIEDAEELETDEDFSGDDGDEVESEA